VSEKSKCCGASVFEGSRLDTDPPNYECAKCHKPCETVFVSWPDFVPAQPEGEMGGEMPDHELRDIASRKGGSSPCWIGRPELISMAEELLRRRAQDAPARERHACAFKGAEEWFQEFTQGLGTYENAYACTPPAPHYFTEWDMKMLRGVRQFLKDVAGEDAQGMSSSTEMLPELEALTDRIVTICEVPHAFKSVRYRVLAELAAALRRTVKSDPTAPPGSDRNPSGCGTDDFVDDPPPSPPATEGLAGRLEAAEAMTWWPSGKKQVLIDAADRDAAASLLRRTPDYDALAVKCRRLEYAIRWALGEGDSDFAKPAIESGPYWWRSKLRELSGLGLREAAQ